MIRIVRVHELDPGVPGARFLVDRLWPRGVARDALALDGWLRDAAPSDELRRWFGHDPEPGVHGVLADPTRPHAVDKHAVADSAARALRVVDTRDVNGHDQSWTGAGSRVSA